MNNFDDLKQIRNLYETQLTKGELDYWLTHGLDYINGGIYTSVSEKGEIIDTDKSVWFQGRALWVFATAYEKYKDPKYLEAATLIIKFIESYCFDESDGRMYFRVTFDGKPVVKRIRYFFSETFAILGFAVYSRITNNKEYCYKAFDLLQFVEKLRTTPGILIPKMTRQSKSFGGPMIILNVITELRISYPEKKEWFDDYVDSLIDEIKTYYVRDELQLVVEQCNPDGTLQKDHFEGRQVNPGHALEGSWFIMNEGLYRGKQEYIDLGLKILDWMWASGWDEKYGGIIQYRDAFNKDLSDYHQDMKFWWPQCEAAIATLLAYSITNKKDYLDKFFLVNNYIQDLFVDNKYGEWYGYFHRDGTLATPIKGNFYKGPFHIPRMYFQCISILDELSEKSGK